MNQTNGNLRDTKCIKIMMLKDSKLNKDNLVFNNMYFKYSIILGSIYKVSIKKQQYPVEISIISKFRIKKQHKPAEIGIQ